MVYRQSVTYFGGGVPYRQFLLSQWQYAVQPVRLIFLNVTRCVSQAEINNTHFWLGPTGGAYDTPLVPLVS